MAEGTKFSGKGYYEYSTGGEYEGEFVDGRQDGFGTMTFPNSRKHVRVFLFYPAMPPYPCPDKTSPYLQIWQKAASQTPATPLSLSHRQHRAICRIQKDKQNNKRHTLLP